MKRNTNDYLIPLRQAEGTLPLGQLLYQATGEILTGGAWPDDVLDDLEVLCGAGYIRMEASHSAHHRRMEKTVWLTEAGRDACGRAAGAQCGGMELMEDGCNAEDSLEDDIEIAGGWL